MLEKLQKVTVNLSQLVTRLVAGGVELLFILVASRAAEQDPAST